MAKAIMIQGTMSNAGKSLLTAGLCRIFSQDGYRVAPFKSQNMALNSYITREGLEMGRAQVVQAQAAGIEPSADMNPILLKPSSDTGSQVIVQGVPVGTMPAREYFQYKKTLKPVIMESYERLCRKYDIIVIEGAGSPAEINLKQDDIVNMGMAKMAGAPVLLAGDIDRGGVFAQLYGTVMLLEPEERARIKGMIINKFRGDKSILDPGVRMIEELCRIPVVGVTPYLKVDIEDEDSLSGRLSAERDRESLIDIAVIRFPRLSNFTDFAVFSGIKEAGIRYVERLADFGEPDMIILPGTKNTMDDLMWLRSSGLEAKILKAAAAGIPLWGICGGYQMMGKELFDEPGTESGVPGRWSAGMGLFPLLTEFQEEKTRTRVSGSFGFVPGIFGRLSGLSVEGYEIHMGKTVKSGIKSDRPEETDQPFVMVKEYQAGQKNAASKDDQTQMRADGWAGGHIYGTYLHGIFDGPGIAEAVVDALLERKGLERLKSGGNFDYEAYRERQFDELAKGLREHLDMDKIYEILEQGIR